jgi:hypothetical protein
VFLFYTKFWFHKVNSSIIGQFSPIFLVKIQILFQFFDDTKLKKEKEKEKNQTEPTTVKIRNIA